MEQHSDKNSLLGLINVCSEHCLQNPIDTAEKAVSSFSVVYYYNAGRSVKFNFI